MKAKVLGLVIVAAGCLAALPAFASPTFDEVSQAQYPSVGTDRDAIWESDIKNSPGGLDVSSKASHFGRSDYERVDDHTWKGPRPMAAPEFGESPATAALTLLLGGLALLRARRRSA